MSDYELRRPSHVNDIAKITQDMINKKIEVQYNKHLLYTKYLLSLFSFKLGDSAVSGRFNWCGDEEMTKVPSLVLIEFVIERMNFREKVL